MNANLEWKIHNLPDSPGCYLMKHEGEIIYVGKAKNLKNRVSQYFHASKNHTPKVLAMVEKIDDFDIVLVDGELEAFTLECNLIKKYLPHYNIKLKDDKQYPYIRVDLNEPFPCPALARRQDRDGARYFGPYQGATVVREVLDVLRSVFPVRDCNYVIRADKPRRPCVQYQIGRCLAPCANLVSEADYAVLINQVVEFLSGKYQPVMDRLTQEMRDAAAEMKYERAALCRDRIRAVENLMQKQKAISTSFNDRDVIAVMPHDADAMVVLLYIRGGRMIGSESFTLEGAGDESMGEVLTQFILQYYSSENIPPSEILLSSEPPERRVIEELLGELAGRRVYLNAPMRGDKLNFVRMAMKNARDLCEKLDKRAESSYARTLGAAKELGEILGLPDAPRRIEGYDISNTQGAQSVGSQVVMIDGVTRHDQYRIYRIKTVQGPNDFASMHEVITRRLTHGLKERQEREAAGESFEDGRFSDLPDLILIDGGKGQLSAAMDAMHEVGLDIPMFGLAKRIEEIVLPYSDESILLDRHSPALHLIERLRDEAHRFGITHHRKLRGKASLSSQLDGIPGVGEKRKRALLKHFQTAQAMRSATVDEIAEVVPRNVAEAVHQMLHMSAKDD